MATRKEIRLELMTMAGIDTRLGDTVFESLLDDLERNIKRDLELQLKESQDSDRESLKLYRAARDRAEASALQVGHLRSALDGPIRKIAYDVKQGGVLGDMLIEEIEKALNDKPNDQTLEDVTVPRCSKCGTSAHVAVAPGGVHPVCGRCGEVVGLRD